MTDKPLCFNKKFSYTSIVVLICIHEVMNTHRDQGYEHMHFITYYDLLHIHYSPIKLPRGFSKINYPSMTDRIKVSNE